MRYKILFQCNAESEDAEANIITRRKSDCSVSWVLINSPIARCQVIQMFPFSGFGKWQHAVILGFERLCMQKIPVGRLTHQARCATRVDQQISRGEALDTVVGKPKKTCCDSCEIGYPIGGRKIIYKYGLTSYNTLLFSFRRAPAYYITT